MSPEGLSRAAARAQQIKTIKDVARRHLAQRGVEGLSLREVAREMDLVSSALYRYFKTRDDLLTALILDAYNDLGRSVERAEARIARERYYERWMSAGRALRRWSRRHPHEYALLYGTPIVGYVAPPETVAAATRVVVVLGTVLSDLARVTPERARRSSRTDAEEFIDATALSSVLPDVEPGDYVQSLMAWTLLYGFVSFELFGHYVGSVTDAAALFDHVLGELAHSLGIEPDPV